MQQSFQLISSEEINKILQSISELKQLILQDRLPATLPLGDWITQKETMQMLGKKPTSLFKLRKEGVLIATKTRPVFYSLKSIRKYLEDRS